MAVGITVLILGYVSRNTKEYQCGVALVTNKGINARGYSGGDLDSVIAI